MRKYVTLVAVASLWCTGVTCTVTWPDDGIGSTTKPLNQAHATISISRLAGASQVTATAVLEDDLGRTVVLDDDQAVRVNNTALSGPSGGQYSATLTAAGDYIVAVQEPTRGVEYTTVTSPADFTVSSPAAFDGVSLSGFTVTWSNASAQAQVIVELSQWLGGTRVVENFGPFSDTGTRSFDATDLRDFRQGATLTITITKFNTRSSIAGFASGTLQATVVTERQATPLP